jgi:hypothetical protein
MTWNFQSYPRRGSLERLQVQGRHGPLLNRTCAGPIGMRLQVQGRHGPLLNRTCAGPIGMRLQVQGRHGPLLNPLVDVSLARVNHPGIRVSLNSRAC